MNSTTLTIEELIRMLQYSDFAPGTKIIFAEIAPKGAEVLPSDIDKARQRKHNDNHPDYRRFVPTAQAVRLMRNKVTPERLRSLARDAACFSGFDQGTHFTDHASPGSVRACWRFHPQNCDLWLEKDADSRLRPRRRNRAS